MLWFKFFLGLKFFKPVYFLFFFVSDYGTVEPLLTDTSLIRTVHLVPGKCPYILCKNNLYNTDPL